MPHPGNAELISFLKVLRVISPPGLCPAPPGPRWAVWPLLRALLLSRAATRPSAVSVATADLTPGRRCAASPELDRRRPQRLARQAPAAGHKPVSSVRGTGPGRLPVSPPSACGPGSVVRSLTHYSSSSQVRSRFLRQRATGCPRPQPRASENCGCLRMKLASCRPLPPGAVPRTHPSGSGHQGRLRNGPQREVDGSGRRGREFGLWYLEFGLRRK